MIRTSLLVKYRPNSTLIKLVMPCNESTWLKVSVCFKVPGLVTAKKIIQQGVAGLEIFLCDRLINSTKVVVFSDLSIISYKSKLKLQSKELY